MHSIGGGMQLWRQLGAEYGGDSIGSGRHRGGILFLGFFPGRFDMDIKECRIKKKCNNNQESDGATVATPRDAGVNTHPRLMTPDTASLWDAAPRSSFAMTDRVNQSNGIQPIPIQVQVAANAIPAPPLNLLK